MECPDAHERGWTARNIVITRPLKYVIDFYPHPAILKKKRIYTPLRKRRYRLVSVKDESYRTVLTQTQNICGKKKGDLKP